MFTVPLVFLLLTFYGCVVMAVHQSWLCRFSWWREPASEPPAWGLAECLAVIAFLFAGQAVCLRLGAGGAGRGRALLFGLLLTVLAAALALALMKRADRGWGERLGLRARRPGRDLALAARVYLGFFPVFVLAALANYGLVYAGGRLLGVEMALNEPQYAVRQLQDPALSGGVRLLLWLYAAGGAPVCEEILFRGLLYGALKRRLDWRWAAAASAAFFAAVHADLLRFLPLMSLGFLLAVLRERGRSLVPGMFVHGLHNCLMVGLLRTLG